jgi:predicted dehydrogenase
MFGFQGRPAVAHFATTRPREPGRRFGLTICGSKGCIWMSTGWNAPAFYLADPTWTVTGSTRWAPVMSDGGGGNERSGRNDLDAGNRAIVADLIRAVETDTQPRTHVRAARTAIEMILACYASHGRGSIVTLPLADRDAHPLDRLTHS